MGNIYNVLPSSHVAGYDGQDAGYVAGHHQVRSRDQELEEVGAMTTAASLTEFQVGGDPVWFMVLSLVLAASQGENRRKGLLVLRCVTHRVKGRQKVSHNKSSSATVTPDTAPHEKPSTRTLPAP